MREGEGEEVGKGREFEQDIKAHNLSLKFQIQAKMKINDKLRKMRTVYFSKYKRPMLKAIKEIDNF